MSFMEPYVYGPEYVWRVETTNGTEYIPGNVVSTAGWTHCPGIVPTEAACLEMFSDYVEGTPESAECVYGYIGRYSADGYMDCTPWHFDTDEDALLAELKDYYGDEDEDEDEDEDDSLGEFSNGERTC